MNKLLLGFSLLAFVGVMVGVMPASPDAGSVALLDASIKTSVSGGGCGTCQLDCKTACTAKACVGYQNGQSDKTSCYQGEECVEGGNTTTCSSTGDGNCMVYTICSDTNCSQGCSTSNSGTKHKCTQSS